MASSDDVRSQCPALLRGDQAADVEQSGETLLSVKGR
jgi:hypothetical protein